MLRRPYCWPRWCEYLREDLLCGENDPLYSKTQIGVGEQGGFAAMGLAREYWSGTGPILDIHRQAFAAAGLPYHNPHCFPHALARLGERICIPSEHFKAGSQKLGHERVLTTFTSYGSVPASRQADLIRRMNKEEGGTGGERLAAMLADTVHRYRAGQ
ncbi:hypothetical protein CHH26_09835 [Qipengyuania flava]|jgi:hypothetical protein|nr:hypothetical protein CHH26_09835 [Qipengyuania flava]